MAKKNKQNKSLTAALQELTSEPQEKNQEQPQESQPQQEIQPQEEEKPKFQKPKLLAEQPPQPCQHVKILDCTQAISRVFCECWHCKQGLLVECSREAPPQDLEATCPHCGKCAIRLHSGAVKSTIPIPSPWGKLSI